MHDVEIPWKFWSCLKNAIGGMKAVFFWKTTCIMLIKTASKETAWKDEPEEPRKPGKSQRSWKVTNPIGNARQEANTTELTTSSNKHNFCCLTFTLPKTTAIDLSHREDLKMCNFIYFAQMVQQLEIPWKFS